MSLRWRPGRPAKLELVVMAIVPCVLSVEELLIMNRGIGLVRLKFRIGIIAHPRQLRHRRPHADGEVEAVVPHNSRRAVSAMTFSSATLAADTDTWKVPKEALITAIDGWLSAARRAPGQLGRQILANDFDAVAHV